MPPYLTKQKVAERYSVTPLSVERMWRDGRLPPPVFPLGPQKPFADLADLEDAERTAVGRPRKAAPPEPPTAA
jgi:hypothetical protein